MRDLPPIHNKRSPEQWRIISEHVDFKDKTVIDLGCGYGDILFRCRIARAKNCVGIDNKTYDKALSIAQNWLFEHIGFGDFDLSNELDKVPASGVGLLSDLAKASFMTGTEAFFDIIPLPWDITICFSVLPYLNNPREVLKWMKQHSTISLIECQYSGDGIATPPSIFGARSGENGEPVYGMYPVENDMEMRMLLEQAGWKSIEAIGKTLIKDRNKYRTVWLCQ